LLANGNDIDGLLQHAAAGLAAAERLHDHVWLPVLLGESGNAYSVLGDWQSAREFLGRGLELAPNSPLLLPVRILMEYQVGDFDQGEMFLKRFLPVAGGRGRGELNVGPVVAMVARITGTNDRFDIAEAAASDILSSSSVNLSGTSTARIAIAMMAVQRSDSTAATEQFSALEFLRGTMLIRWGMSADRLLGLLSRTMGNLDQAATHFENALVFCRKAGYRPDLAWTCCDYSDTLRERDAAGDRAKAMSLLDESLAISSELGMRPLMERVLSRREILKA